MEDLQSDNTGNTKQKRILNETFVMPEERHNTGSLSAADNNGIEDENIIKNQKVDRSLVMKRCSNIIGVELFRNTNFVLLMVSYVLWALSVIVLLYIPPLCVWSFGMSPEKAAILMSLLGLFTTIGELLLGVFVDLLHFSSNKMYIFSLLIFSVTAIMMPHCNTFEYIAPVICLSSIALGFTVSLRLVLITEVVGLEHSTKAYSILCVGGGTAELVSTPLFGMFYDITGSFLAVFYGAGACAFLGLLFFLLIPFRNRFCVK